MASFSQNDLLHVESKIGSMLGEHVTKKKKSHTLGMFIFREDEKEST